MPKLIYRIAAGLIICCSVVYLARKKYPYDPDLDTIPLTKRQISHNTIPDRSLLIQTTENITKKQTSIDSALSTSDIINCVGNCSYPNLKYHIGALSAEKYFHTRASDVYHTWGAEAKSMSFYVGKHMHNVEYDLKIPVIEMKEVSDTVYPPREKSFSMLKYWCSNLLDTYDWFVKVDDDTYVYIERLESFLWALNETEKYHIGRPGVGFAHEIKQLGLYGNTFCTGPTVIYSKPLLKELCPHLDTCMQEFKTLHEDTEVARCLISKTGLQCADNNPKESVNLKLGKLFYHGYGGNQKITVGGKIVNGPLFQNAVTLHPVKTSMDMFLLHHYYRKWKAEKDISPIEHQSNPLHVYQKKATYYKAMCTTSKCIAEPTSHA